MRIQAFDWFHKGNSIMMYKVFTLILVGLVLTDVTNASPSSDYKKADEQQQDNAKESPNIVDPSFLIGKWEEKDNSKKEIENLSFSRSFLTFTKAKNDVVCEGSSSYKAEGQSWGALNSGEIKGKVVVTREAEPGKSIVKEHLFVKQEGSDNPNTGIFIEIINDKTISVREREGGDPLGGLNVTFDGVYLRKK